MCCDVAPRDRSECDLMTSPHVLDKLFQVFSHWISNTSVDAKHHGASLSEW